MKYINKLRGKKIERLINDKNIYIYKYINNKNFIIDEPLYFFNKLLENFKNTELALKYLTNISIKFNFEKETLKLALNINNSEILVKEILSSIKDSESKRDWLNYVITKCYNPNYLYILVNEGADINFKEEDKESLIINLAKEFVKRDVCYFMKNLNIEKNYKGYEYMLSSIKVAFKLGANPNDFYLKNGFRKDIFDIIAEGYNKQVHESLSILHKKQYRDIFSILCYNKVKIKDSLRDKKLYQSIKELSCDIEKEELSKLIKNTNTNTSIKPKRL